MKKLILKAGFVCSLILFLSSTALYSQSTITGKVVDDTGDALIGANVIVKGSTDGTITDIDGSFSFRTNQGFPLTLQVSFTGYNTEEVSLSGPTSNLIITMASGILLSDDVVVSASRKREKVQEAPASISVLTARKLEGSPNPTDPTRNLVNVAGVQVQQQSANRINISMRGGAGLFGTSVFPILDYRSLIGPGIGTFQSDQVGLNQLDLERIEVVRGPGSALYGPGVTQGVVHFISKNPIDYTGTSVELMGGELSTLGFGLRHAGANEAKTFGYKINVTHRQGNEFTLDPNDPDDALQIAKFIRPNPVTGQRGVFQPAVRNGVVDAFGQPRQLLSLADLDKNNDGNPMANDWRNTSVNTTLEFRPQNDLRVTLSGGYNTGKSVFYNEQGEGLFQANEFWTQARVQKGGLFAQLFYVNNDGGSQDNPTFLYQTSNRTPVGRTQLEGQLQYNFDVKSFLNSNWTAGFDYRFAGQDTENLVYGRNENDDDFSVLGGYIQGKLELSKKIDLVVAGRYDRFNFIDEGAFAPRAALVYKASPNHTFRGSFNRANSTVSNLQLNIDFPLSVVSPTFDIWLFGNKVEQTFNNPQTGWLLPGIPRGLNQLPLAFPFAAVNTAVSGGLAQGLGANPATAPLVPLISALLGGINPGALGLFSGPLSPGFNIFDGQSLGLINAPVSQISTNDTWEIGYKGFIKNKLGIMVDVYRVREDRNSSFTAISPAYRLTNLDRLGTELGAAVVNQIRDQFIGALVQQGFPLPVAQGTFDQLAPVIAGAYAQGGAAVAANLQGLPFHATTPTNQVPDDGIVHLAAGYRTFDPRVFWGSDLGLEYFVNGDFSIFANYSWLSDVEFTQNVVTPTGEKIGAPIQTFLNVPKNKYRIGFTYTPIKGFNANLAFQHDDSYFASAGQFSGDTEVRNLVDAGVGYKFTNGLSINLTATNLFNNEYRYYVNMPRIGRRTLVNIRYDIGGK